MNRSLFRLLALPLFLVVAPDFSAQEKDKPKPRKKRPAPVVSPTIHENGDVTFRVKALGAEKVSVTGEMVNGRLTLEKDGNTGIWSGTLEKVEPGIYGYSFDIDGVKQVDPGNPALKPMRSPRTSVLHIPGGNIFDFDPEIPHGTVRVHGYYSKPILRYREMRVYTPPGYESNDDEHYPVLVLQHGHSDAGSTWTEYGKAHWILDNLIAAEKAVPMIVVMLDGHPIPESYGNGRSPENTEELRRDLVEAALPLVESLYRVKSTRKNRAIAGLSMGGLHSLTIGLNELDKFSRIGAFSAAIPAPEAVEAAFKNPDQTNEQIELLWIACGKTDFLLEENRDFVDRLKKTGIDHQFLLTEGGHSWPVWRQYLAEFAPLLFR